MMGLTVVWLFFYVISSAPDPFDPRNRGWVVALTACAFIDFLGLVKWMIRRFHPLPTDGPDDDD